MNMHSTRARKVEPGADEPFHTQPKKGSSESIITGETESTGGDESHNSSLLGNGSEASSSRLSNSVTSSLRRSQAVENEATSNIVLSSKERSMISGSQNVKELTVNKLRFSSVGLQGRDLEKAMLMDCLEKTTKEIVFISGYSGTGKSALANSLMEPVEKRGGAFVTGKFDIHSRDQPYVGIAAACREICGKIISEGDEKVQAIRKKLVDELGAELCILANMVPALEEVVSSQEGQDLHPCRAQHPEDLKILSQQLNIAFRRFVRIVCSFFEPLVMVLDDLQWSDVASLDLLEALITDRQNTKLLLIGCYRSNEVDEAHVVSKTRRDLQDKSDRGGAFSIREIEVKNLSLSDVNQVTAALLGIDDVSRTEGLAKICFNRTQGNCFFLLAFVMMLEKEGLLEFNLGSFQWTWDCERIEEETASTDNVVDLLVKKMNQLPNDLCQLLQVAACLGSKFDEKVLRLVWAQLSKGEGEDMVPELLDQAVQQSFLESTGNSGYRWVHDKIKEAALSLVQESDLLSLQFDIGKILWRGLKGQELDASIFLIVSLLDTADDLEETENLVIAELSAKAATKAKELSAFMSALKFAATGISRLPNNKWESHYELSLELYCTAAKSEGILANSESMQVYADEVLSNARSFRDKLEVFFVLVDRMGHDGRTQEATDLALDALRHLKVKMPRNGVIQTFSAISGLFSTKKTLETVNVEKLPLMTDTERISSMKLLYFIATFSCLLKSKVRLLNSVIKAIELTVTHGVSASSPSAFATFGLVVAGVLKDLQAGTMYAEMAIAMLRKTEAKSAEAAVMFRTWGFTLSYTRPLHDTLKPLLNGYKLGVQTGDTQSAAYCMLSYASSSFLQSKPLKMIEEDCRIYIPHMRELGRGKIAQLANFIHLAVLYLMGRTDSCELISNLAGQPKLSELSRLVYRSALFTYLGEYEKGADDGIAFGDICLKKAPGAMSCQGECFTRSVCLYAMARKTNKRNYKKHARDARKTIKSWVEAGNMNSKHHLCLLDAEEAALCGETAAAVSRHYEEAIVTAARSGFLRDAGLANERYAEFLLHEGADKDKAKYRVHEAIRYYQDWGAQRKVSILQTKYADLVGIQADSFICVPSTVSLGRFSSFDSK